MKVKDMYPDKWLKAEHLRGCTVPVTIEAVTIESLFNPEARKYEKKFVLHFYKKNLPMICNKTQAITLTQITGNDDSDGWKGHQINLSPASTPNGKQTIAITRPTAPKPEEQPAVTPPPETPAA